MTTVPGKILIVLCALVLAVFAAEGASRVVFDPIDFLKPTRIPDPVLRYAIEPGTGAHDAWGFRNKSVPGRADIVTVGDSHTYGISATAADSWPSQLGRLRGESVYNISLGGYGPAEYYYLMADKGIRLGPRVIIAGFYLGNDFKDSYNAVYSIPLWEGMRRAGTDAAPDIDAEDDLPGKSSGIGEWLAGHSVLYRLVSSSSLGDALRQRRREGRGDEILMLEIGDTGIRTGFTPDRRLEGLDLDKPNVREGLGLSLGFFNRMNELVMGTQTRLIVVIIPTKESVYAEYLEGEEALPGSPKIKRLIENERLVNEEVKAYFDEHGIEYVDVLDALRAAAGKEQLYPNNFGGHTNKRGYRVIAETVDAYLRGTGAH